ncbi:carbonate dehydratase [Pseudoalteromonas viridis]|uniref:Carbonic anhydrase n=1 Tax=Pseudoalteromonas viridis TaxID=339617 RepID=A0ABX7V5Q2_9GAMM|nr:carbonate dehydratase [Pseudoalteromonas viridis]QTL36209.1 carbonate dehydratase [Pseudoalteromonas viridis]
MCQSDSQLQHLLNNNRQWAKQTQTNNPEFFAKLSMQQNPNYLWIGCSDSRVPANQIVDLMPGDLFVHRNVANVVVHTDHNCLSVMQYAIEVLKVEHVLIVGHYGCGGVRAALEDARLGLIDNWLRHVGDVKEMHQAMLNEIQPPQRCDALCELNVIEQVRNVCRTNVVQDAWARGQKLTIHGWVYGLADGLLKELNTQIEQEEQLATHYERALVDLAKRYQL